MDNSPYQLRISDSRHMQIPHLNEHPRTRGMLASEMAMRGSASASGVSQENSSSDFLAMVQDGLREVEGLDRESNRLTQKSVIDPDSVEAHEVVIAAQKASFALNLTKTLSEGFIRTYRELTSLR